MIYKCLAPLYAGTGTTGLFAKIVTFFVEWPLEMRSYIDADFLLRFGDLFWWRSKFEHCGAWKLNVAETQKLSTILAELESKCSTIGLRVSPDRVKSVRSRIIGRGGDGACDTKTLVPELQSIWEVISGELKEQKAVHIPEGKRKYFDQEALFGNDVYAKFSTDAAKLTGKTI